MGIIDSVLETSVNVILGIVRAGGTDHRQLANASEYIAADYHGRAIFELLQNASDQAVAAKLADSRVTIIRTSQILAVANEGVPFSEAGVRAITSLALSAKDPENFIGNKGVGFKSVFELSDSPEIYTSLSPDTRFTDDKGLRFKLSTQPFSDPSFRTKIEMMARGRMNDADTLSLDNVMSELNMAAPFKFPMPLGAEALASRLEEMGCTPPGQTLVVLPLRRAPDSAALIERSLDGVSEHTGEAILFIPSITSIRLVDHIRSFDRTVARNVAVPPRDANGGRVLDVTTSVLDRGREMKRSWVKIQRKMGEADYVSEAAARAEAAEINRAAGAVPGGNWGKVRTSPIEVAIPIAARSEADLQPLGARGRICIGLATKELTGTPACINAHFHGTISRTGIDFADNKYNALLFKEAVRLHSVLIGYLKSSSDIAHRRTATLALERSKGPLAKEIQADISLAEGDIILAADGQTFCAPSKILFCNKLDLEMLFFISDRIGDLGGLGINLPDHALARKAEAVLKELVPHASKEDVAELLLGRGAGGQSFLEHVARLNRGEGSGFWHKFLEWAVDGFGAGLREQAILPVGEGDLAAASDRVFLPFATSAAEAEEVSEVPHFVRKTLRFIDDGAVPVRRPGSGALTELGKKLAPDAGEPLVRRPRRRELLDEIGVLMGSPRDGQCATEERKTLLKQAIFWLQGMDQAHVPRATKDGILVPTALGAEAQWAPAGTLYFGAGWVKDKLADDLLQKAYGDEPGRTLLPWEQSRAVFDLAEGDRNEWFAALRCLGCRFSPQIRHAASSIAAPFKASWVEGNRLGLIPNTPCPIEGMDQYWRDYLESTRTRPFRRSNSKYNFASVTWIDGLERETGRAAVVRLLLLSPEEYEKHATTTLAADATGDIDGTEVPSLWAHAISAGQWAIIPTDDGDATASDAWLPDGGMESLKRGVLKRIPPEFSNAKPLLARFGLTTIDNATLERLLHGLDVIGRACADFGEGLTRAAIVLAHRLFARWQAARRNSDDTLPGMSQLSFPMQKAGGLVGVLGKDINVAYCDDNPVRARFIPGFADALVWPIAMDDPPQKLIDDLRGAVGAAAATLTSEAAVETGFCAESDKAPMLLSHWLSSTFPGHPVSVDLACLRARGADPAGERFQKTWKLFAETALTFGTFPVHSPRAYFYDLPRKVLQVSSELYNEEVVEASWTVFGLTYQDTWAGYANSLRKGTERQFLVDHGVTVVKREKVERAVGIASFENLKIIVLALWREMARGEPIEAFEPQWERNGRSIASICTWLGRPELAQSLDNVANFSEEASAVEFIRLGVISSGKWRDARAAIGQAPLGFKHKRKGWEKTVANLRAQLMVLAVRSETTNLNAIAPALRDRRLQEIPGDVEFDAEGIDEVPRRVSRLALEILEAPEYRESTKALIPHVDCIANAQKSVGPDGDTDAHSDLAVQVYRDVGEDKRTTDATVRIDGLLALAADLAPHLKEAIDLRAIRAVPRICALADGYWANRILIVTELERCLRKACPSTAVRMGEADAFARAVPANELRALFSELAGGTPATNGQPPPRMIAILGRSKAETDVARDLRSGTSGELGGKLREYAIAQQGFVLPAPADQRCALPVHHKGAVVKGERGRNWAHAPGTAEARTRAGLISEIFVYEWLRIRCPSFDQTCWYSSNRDSYVCDGDPGNDSLGYDFAFHDQTGELSGDKRRPNCCIEVKSTSTADGSQPFPMSANEWEKAKECHQSDDSIYIIFRIANVLQNPQIFDVVHDPFGLYMNKRANAILTKDILLHVAAREPQAVTSPLGA